MKKIMRIVLWVLFACFALLIVAAVTDITVPSNTHGTSRDLLLYRIALISVFSSFAICCLVGVRCCSFPKTQKIKLAPKLVTCAILLTAGIVAFCVLFFCTSDVFQNEMTSLYDGDRKTDWAMQNNTETTVTKVLTTEPEASTPPATTKNEETTSTTEPSIADNTEKPMQPESEYVTKDAPLTLVFKDDVYTVGNCDFTLDRLEMVYELYKAYPGLENPSYAKYIRVHITVTNQSSQPTTFYAKKAGSWNMGTYYTATGEVENIGANSNYKWLVDPDLKSASDFVLEPQETRTVCITGMFINEEQIKYDDLPKIDLFFRNEENALTVSIN